GLLEHAFSGTAVSRVMPASAACSSSERPAASAAATRASAGVRPKSATRESTALGRDRHGCLPALFLRLSGPTPAVRFQHRELLRRAGVNLRRRSPISPLPFGSNRPVALLRRSCAPSPRSGPRGQRLPRAPPDVRSLPKERQSGTLVADCL